MIADWTTAGPFRELTWLTIVFSLTVIFTLILSIYEVQQTIRNYVAVKLSEKNGAMEILSESSVFKSLGRLFIQFCFLILSIYSILISIRWNNNLYWYRVIFIISFILAEGVLSLLIINDIVARKKLEEIISKYYQESKHE